jgi:hypothetical protein
MEKNNLHYFTFFPNSEKPIKAVIRHPPTETPAEGISNILENSSFNAINVRQITATRRTPNGKTHVESLPLFLFTLTRNIKYKKTFKNI